MSKSIQLTRNSTIWVPGISSYKMLVISSGNEDTPGKIFVNQRIKNFSKDSFDDVFVAVATPVQLEDFAEDAPDAGTSYYRTNRIELIARTVEELNSVFQSMLFEIDKLVLDLSDLDKLSAAGIYVISAGEPITYIDEQSG